MCNLEKMQLGGMGGGGVTDVEARVTGGMGGRCGEGLLPRTVTIEAEGRRGDVGRCGPAAGRHSGEPRERP